MSEDIYETPALLAQYLLFHYGTPADTLPAGVPAPPGSDNFPARCAQRLLAAGPTAPHRALDLGCAVGRASFELARGVPEVIGLDLSHQFVAAARQLQQDGALVCQRVDEGDLATPIRLVVPPEIDRSRVRFVEGDASHLSSDLGQFDLVLLANLVDRLADPAACLQDLASLVAPGGAVLVASPYTWMESFTPRSRWLGGRTAGDAAHPTYSRIGDTLGSTFSLVERGDLPFLIREHARKFQWSVAEFTVWRRR